MDARQILGRLRGGVTLTADELEWFARGLASGNVTDAQAGAFAMGVCTQGLSSTGRVALTQAMRDSGDVLKWHLDAPIVDKHSTGGIGDSTSFLLAPALAACGAYVPMISGRGLGHTGGTLDKLEAIPGVKTEVNEAKFRKIVGEIGCAIVSATSDMAPADKRLYAIRDVTGTVASIDLITASILAKKLAAGLETLVLDIKVGSGAFMKTMDDAEELAQSLVSTANQAGCKTTALITDMNQPLAKSMGNALEIMEAVQCLNGDEQDQDLPDLSAALGGELLASAGLADNAEEGALQIMDSFYDGSAAECFQKMIAALGGPGDFVERWHDRLPAAPIQRDIFIQGEGYITGFDGEALGHAVVTLGGGRLRDTDKIDPSVGLSDIASIGDIVDRNIPVAVVHAASESAADQAETAVRAAITISTEDCELPPAIYNRVS
ncbi:thymidine phosphorylase [Parasulfitobacter algicola]|uniref:Thymidine phosphorylase n=1 Tax=Parasulfitobacter algicola TaxID=2614809 RepID=A0ABX2IP04_9RHOB|nr:thymidine phosphorylase [Sulfitobacter algicola]NSX54285.1 thymidine phosphorylase [Sulfitobacter algicola]